MVDPVRIGLTLITSFIRNDKKGIFWGEMNSLLWNMGNEKWLFVSKSTLSKLYVKPVFMSH